MYASLLATHILGAVATGVVGLFVCVALVTQRERLMRTLSVTLATLSAFEVLTGVALAVFSPSVSVASVCGNIAVYLGFVIALQVPLFMRMKGGVSPFPMVQTISSAMVSLAVVLTGLVLGF